MDAKVMPAGRPTKYTKALIDKCKEYMGAYQELGDVIPSHVGLFLFLDISKTCAYDWAKEEDKKEFSAILDQLMIMQERALFNGGLNSSMNSAIVKLALGKHGYSDKQELTGKDGDHLIPDGISISFVKPK